MDWEQATHYEVLQVAQGAPLAVIKASYRVLVQQYHPDRYKPVHEAERITKRLNEAYGVLSDAELRAAYDSYITGRSGQQQSNHTSPPEAEPPSTPRSDKLSVHPWRRFLARVIDTLWLALLLGYLIGLVIPAWAANANLFVLSIVIGALILPIEAWFISVFRKTPGKWIFGIEVSRKNGERLSYGSAFQRAFNVWLSGQALGLPALFGIACAYWFFSLKKNSTTAWDTTSGSEVHHSNISAFPYLVGVVALFASGVLTNMALRDNTERMIAEKEAQQSPTVAPEPSNPASTPQQPYGEPSQVAGEEYLDWGWQNVTNEQFSAGVNAWFQKHPEYNNSQAQQAINSHFQEVTKQYPVIALGRAIDMALQRALTAGREAEYQRRQEEAQIPPRQAATYPSASRRSIDNADPGFVDIENESFARMAAGGKVQSTHYPQHAQVRADYPTTQAEIDDRNKTTRAAVEDMSKGNIPGAYKRYDYKSGQEIWVDANGTPLN